MCAKIIRVRPINRISKVLALAVICWNISGGSALALDLSSFKKTCSEIGFKAGTEKHGECVVRLYSRSKKSVQKQEATQADQEQRTRIEQQQREIIARQNQIEELNKQRVIAAQKAAEEAKTQRRLNSFALILNGLSMMSGGRPATPSYHNPPSASSNGFLKGQRVSGFNRICTYSTVTGDKTLTIGNTGICPLTY